MILILLPKEKKPDLQWDVDEKTKDVFNSIFVVLVARLVPGELSTGPLLRWVMVGELRQTSLQAQRRGEGI